jgi:hypothetical protein
MTTELKNKLAELAKGYTFNHGIIRNPGKFEGESLATLYYYDCYLNGGETIFQVTNEESHMFNFNPEDNKNWVYLAESNDGFVSLVFFKTEEAAQKYEYEEQGIDIDDIDSLDSDYEEQEEE